jgi:hypothetical protein
MVRRRRRQGLGKEERHSQVFGKETGGGGRHAAVGAFRHDQAHLLSLDRGPRLADNTHGRRG